MKGSDDWSEIRAFWDARYAKGLVYGTQPTSVARRLAQLFHREGVVRLFDAGCGSGRDTLYFAGEGFVVTGLDLSERAIERARQRASAEGIGVSLLVGDLLSTDVPGEPFDATVAIHLVHLQPEPIRRAMVNRLWGLTRDGGLFAMANYSTEEAGFTTWAPFPERNTRVDPKGKLVHFFDDEDLDTLLPPHRFDLLAREILTLDEFPDSGPATHREWLTVARKIRAC